MKYLVPTLLLSAAFLQLASASAAEILPAAADAEDLNQFDRSVVLPAKAAAARPSNPNALGTAISNEARKLRQEVPQAGGNHTPSVAGNRDGGNANDASSVSAAAQNETSSANAAHNSGKGQGKGNGNK